MASYEKIDQEDVLEARARAEKRISTLRTNLEKAKEKWQNRLEEEMSNYQEIQKIINGLYLKANLLYNHARILQSQAEVDAALLEREKIQEIYNRIDELDAEQDRVKDQIEKIQDDFLALNLDSVVETR